MATVTLWNCVETEREQRESKRGKNLRGRTAWTIPSHQITLLLHCGFHEVVQVFAPFVRGFSTKKVEFV